MFLYRPSQSPHRSLGSTAVLTVQLVLAFFAWAGPVPAGHDHETLVSCRASCAELAEHLDRCHGDMSGGLPQGWHLHWVFAGDDQSVLTSAAGSNSSTLLVSIADAPEPPLLATQLPGTDALGADSWSRSASPPSFFGTFCCQRSLPEKLGILRC